MASTDSSYQAMPRGLDGIADSVRAYAGSLAMVAVSTLIGLWIAPRWGTAPVDMIYLPAVLAAAAIWGLGPGLLAGALGHGAAVRELRRACARVGDDSVAAVDLGMGG